jgi:hypothetical protein
VLTRNQIAQFSARQSDAGFLSMAQQLNLLTVGGETGLNAQTPAFATTLWAVTYKVHRQVVLDTALDVGITNGAPHKRILFGFTYAVANLYARHGER